MEEQSISSSVDLTLEPFPNLLVKLSKEYNNKGVRDNILNLFFENHLNEIIFHLPQLAIFYSNTGNNHIIKLLHHFGEKNQCFLFLSRWIFQAFCHSKTSLEFDLDPIFGNSKIPFNKNILKDNKSNDDLSWKSSNSNCFKSQDSNTKSYRRRNTVIGVSSENTLASNSLLGQRSKNSNLIGSLNSLQEQKSFSKHETIKLRTSILYNNNPENNKSDFLDMFIKTISNFSLFLKLKDKSERLMLLRLFLKKLNAIIFNNKRKIDVKKLNPDKVIQMGIFLPFSYETSKNDSCLIVNFLEDEISCFNTKKRVPYKMTVECVNPFELLTFLKDKLKNNLSVSEYFNNNNTKSLSIPESLLIGEFFETGEFENLEDAEQDVKTKKLYEEIKLNKKLKKFMRKFVDNDNEKETDEEDNEEEKESSLSKFKELKKFKILKKKEKLILSRSKNSKLIKPLPLSKEKLKLNEYNLNSNYAFSYTKKNEKVSLLINKIKCFKENKTKSVKIADKINEIIDDYNNSKHLKGENNSNNSKSDHNYYYSQKGDLVLSEDVESLNYSFNQENSTNENNNIYNKDNYFCKSERIMMPMRSRNIQNLNSNKISAQSQNKNSKSLVPPKRWSIIFNIDKKKEDNYIDTPNSKHSETNTSTKIHKKRKSIFSKSPLEENVSIKSSNIFAKIYSESEEEEKEEQIEEVKTSFNIQKDLSKLVFDSQNFSKKLSDKDTKNPLNKFDNYIQSTWKDKKKKIREQSLYKSLESYKIKQIIIKYSNNKANDDLRQELIIMQLMKLFSNIFQEENTGIVLLPYEIIVTSADSGFLEFVADSFSVDQLKSDLHSDLNLVFRSLFKNNLLKSQINFIQSLAGYSLFCYFFQIKDRHNGNILLTADGFIAHIDFGFAFTTSPGNINFERAPFKLTKEYVDIMNGIDSDLFCYFKILLAKAFHIFRKPEIQNRINSLLVVPEKFSKLKCFKNFDLSRFWKRFQLNLPKKQIFEHVELLIEESYDSIFTNKYDDFQKMTNGIEK